MNNLTKIKLFFIPLLIVYTGNLGCKKGNECEVTYLPDLVFDSFKSTFDKVENDKEYYTISHTVTNGISDILGCELYSQSAGKCRFFQKIKFSENANFSSSVVVDSSFTEINELAPGKLVITESQLAFLQNGYYEIQGFIDIDQIIKERNENNNGDERLLERSSSAIKSNNIIPITHASEKPVFDSNGNRVFFQTISTTIKYE